MKNKLLTVNVLMLLCISLMGYQWAYAETTLHPRNKMLISKGLIPPMKYFPDVPRVTPAEAKALYLSQKAVFVAVGLDVPRLPNAWLLKDYNRFDPNKLPRYGIAKNHLIVTYCG